ncbi:hypothetical protein CSV67_06425 [Sporosarcina sp. P2]|nr:hypothetical protein CSV67_06425 [Sporosarcina sp. P2]
MGYPQYTNPYWQGADPQGFSTAQSYSSWQPWFPGMQWFPSMPGFPGSPSFPQQPNFPGQQPGRPGNPGSPNQGGQAVAPTSPPPSQIPSYPEFQMFAVDPGAIAGCLYRFTYVWTSRRNGFWFYPTFVGRQSVAGFQWNSRRFRWEYIGIDLQRIEQFRCV